MAEEYRKKLHTPEDIAASVQDGWCCCTDIAASIPPALMEALAQRVIREEVKNLRLHTMLDLWNMSALSAEAAKGILPVSWYSTATLRNAVNEGRGDVMPSYYRDFPDVYRNHVPVDAFFCAVSSMDEHGFFSTGVVGSITEAAKEKARHIYVEVNQNMPRAIHGPQIHISEVTALCENNVELPVNFPTEIDETSRIIGGFIAEQIPDEATIQLGIGSVPESVASMLDGKKNLGIHSELFTEGMVDLIEKGIVTNACKPIHRGKSIATLTFGSKKIYDYIDNNPAIALLPVDQVNNPVIIAEHPNFMSVNAALEIDFWGQVCAESIGTRHISGTGGQVDYVRGARLSKGGKSFIAFPSTAKGGTVSRIKPMLTQGAIVTTGKNDVDYIVTEYGIAALRGRTLSERAKALIRIAHPDFRDELVYAAKKENIII